MFYLGKGIRIVIVDFNLILIGEVNMIVLVFNGVLEVLSLLVFFIYYVINGFFF